MRPTIYIPSRLMQLLARLTYPPERGVHPITSTEPKGSGRDEVEPRPPCKGEARGSAAA
jgi:hypothetical protein